MRALETSLDIVVDFRSSLSKIRPQLGLFQEAMLVGPLGGPDYTGRGSRWIKTSTEIMLEENQIRCRDRSAHCGL